MVHTLFTSKGNKFGKDKDVNIGQYVKEFGVNNALILFGLEWMKKNGQFDRVGAFLEEQCPKTIIKLSGFIIH